MEIYRGRIFHANEIYGRNQVLLQLNVLLCCNRYSNVCLFFLFLKIQGATCNGHFIYFLSQVILLPRVFFIMYRNYRYCYWKLIIN